MTYRKKLIEVALPLEAINKLSAEEKAVPRRGHPQTMHLWFARRPLAACRAVLFASLVDDPSSHPDKFPTEEAQLEERQRLFDLIERLVKWENSKNPHILAEARAEILKSTDGNPPPVLDPFSGGGSIPLEAQRLGLEAHASDLNPVPVLINKALIEIPPKFAGRPPVNPKARGKTDYSRTWTGAEGLAEDVRYYGQWIRDEAEKRIGNLYPKIKLPKEYGGGESKVLAWFWARTVKCLNPACKAVMPLVRSFTVSAKKKEKTWAEPVIDRSQLPPIVRFEMKTGTEKPPDGTVSRRGATCICCGTPTTIASTGWETMLEGLLRAGFSINGTWPMRTERSARTVAIGTNALASSIVLVCRPRPESAPSTTRRQFLTTLKRELPEALKTLQQGNIAPVDLAQASIGPGMAVFSRYAKVLEADGTPMRVRTALQLINQTLDEYFTEQEGAFDADTRWALTWFEQHQFDEGKYGDAETLSKAKNTSVTGLVNSGILNAKGGKVRLLRRDELPDNWTPEQDDRTPDWEVTQHLIRTLDQKGETGASVLLSKLGDRGEVARDLAYRLYSICDRKGWTQEAIAYNSLVISWPEISRLAAEKTEQPVQGELF